MLQILDFNQGNIVATRATEKLDEADYDELLPLLNQKLEENDKIRWYFEMEDFTGWEGKAFWQDVNFDAKHLNDLERVAMVGDRKWQDLMTNLMKPFTSAEVKFYDLNEKEEAERWIRS